MKGKNHTGSVFQRSSDGRWAVQITVAPYKRRYKYFETREDAEKYRSERCGEARNDG